MKLATRLFSARAVRPCWARMVFPFRSVWVSSNSLHPLPRSGGGRQLEPHPSLVEGVQFRGFYFHAHDDSAEVRERLFKWIHQTDWSLEMVVGRKIPALFAKKHNANDSEFYADLLSHLLKKTNINVASGRSSISPNGINPPRITFWRFGTGPAKGHRTFCQETERGGNFFRSGFQRAKPHAPSRCLPCRIIWRGPFSACLSVAKPATTNSCASEFRWWWTSTTRRNTREVGTITRPSVR
jgi:hypothetical protein